MTDRQDKEEQSRRLDLELEQTFPASDPIPWIHEAAHDVKPLYFEDLSIGARFATDSAVVKEDQIKAFAALYDPQPFHLDHEMARDSLFQTLVASGWHTAAIAMGLLVRSPFRIAGGLIGLGGEIKWLRPVRPGDALRVTAEVLEMRVSRSKPDRGIVTVSNQTSNQRGEIVQSAVMQLSVPRRVR